MDDRRSDPRFPLQLVAKLLVDESTFWVEVKDVSRGGICLLAPHPILVGSELFVEVTLPVPELPELELPTRLAVRAVWSTKVPEGHQIGLAFHQIDAEALAGIERLIEVVIARSQLAS